MKQFKTYTQDQLEMFPLDIGQLIGKNHLVRVISEFVDRVSVDILMRPFSKEGNPPYHPVMMMKVLLYSYSIKLFSTRKIERALLQDVTYMWLSGMQTPDHNTINRFRSFYFKEILDEVFCELLDFLHEQGYIRFETYFVDGTKIEADANKFSYVWKKNTQRYKEQLKAKVGKLIGEIDQLNKEEDVLYGDKSLEELGKGNNIDGKNLKEAVNNLNEKLEGTEKTKTKRSMTSKVKELKKAADKLDGYESQEKILGERNSYSKTDKDATFMRMKNDELKPGYNPQVSSENQFVVNYTVSQNAADTTAFPGHLEKIKARGKKYIPNNYVGDAGYGSEENYHNLDKAEINNYLKYNTFHSDIKGNNKNPFHKDNMQHDGENDCFVCPYGRKLIFQKEEEQVTDHGYVSKVRVYECTSCKDCPLKEKCTKAKGNRVIHVRPKLEEHKKQAKENLTSKTGVKFRKKRGPEIETFFGDLKMNQGYRRFRLRGKEKAHLEMGWLCMTYNLRKLHKIECNKLKMSA